jgi:hypothetical protein
VELQQAQITEGAAVADEVMVALERNGVSFVGLPGKKDAKKDGSRGRGAAAAAALQLPSTVRIDIPATNPGRTALKVWEELVNVLRKDGADPAAAFVHRKKIQHAEKNIRDAFMALYRGLELLKKFRYPLRPHHTYRHGYEYTSSFWYLLFCFSDVVEWMMDGCSSLNVKAFTKILKKFVKVRHIYTAH